MSLGTYLAWSVLVFAGAAAYDYVFGKYLMANAGLKSISAANWSVTTYLIGLIGLSSVLTYSIWFAIPECLGLWVGTFAVTELERIRDLD